MRVVLVDDEEMSLSYLEYQLNGACKVEIVGKYTNPVESRDVILREKVDVVFLDIQMPEVNGIEFAEQLLEKKPDLQVVFITAYNRYAVQAFELNAIDYVMKPFAKVRLMKTLMRLQEKVFINESQKIEDVNREVTMQLFREVMIRSSNEPFTKLKWRTAKAQELFLYLIQHRGEAVRKDTLIELLWSDYDTDKAYQQLYATIYQIRKTLAPYQNHFTVSSISEGYILQVNNVQFDTEVWENGVKNRTEFVKTGKLESFSEVMDVYKGDYLLNFDYWWAESERERLKLLWMRTAFWLGEAYEEAGQLEKAIALYLEVCERSPLTEEAYFSLMLLFANDYQNSSVHKQYQLLSSVLKEEMNAEPSSYIREWYEHWSSQFQGS